MSSPRVIAQSTGRVGVSRWIGIPLLVLLVIAPLVSIAVLAKGAAPGRQRVGGVRVTESW